MVLCDEKEGNCEKVANGDVRPASDLEHALEKDVWHPAANPVIVQGCCHETPHKCDAHRHNPMSVATGTVEWLSLTSRVQHYLLMKYAVCLDKAPCCFICFYLLLFTVVFAVMWRGIEIEKDFSVFIRSDGEALRNRDALTAALEKQKSLSGRRLSEPPTATIQNRIFSADYTSTPDRGSLRGLQDYYYSHFVRRHIEFVYQANDGNALDEKVLREVRDFESSLRNLPKWQELCVTKAWSKDSVWLCNPGMSVAKWAWASRTEPNRTLHGDAVAFDVHLDANSRDLLPVSWMLPYMRNAWMSGDVTGDVKRFFPEDWDAKAYLDGTGSPPATIKSEFFFVVGYEPESLTQADVQKADRAVKAEVKDFFQRDVYEVIEAWLDVDPEEVGQRHMQIFYKEGHIDERELQLSLDHDLLLSAGSVAFVSLWMWVHMKSILLSAACFFILFSSVAMAFVLSPAEKATLASLSPVFLITIIDIDVIFVFVNFWIQSKGSFDTTRERIVWTMWNAGKSCLATSLTTSVCFFANLFSSLQPLREFGLLMGLCVMIVYVSSVLFLPPVMILESRLGAWRDGLRKAQEALHHQTLRTEEIDYTLSLPKVKNLEDTSSLPKMKASDDLLSLPKLKAPEELFESRLPSKERRPSKGSVPDDLLSFPKLKPPEELFESRLPSKERRPSKGAVHSEQSLEMLKASVVYVSPVSSERSPAADMSLMQKFFFYLVDRIARYALRVLCLTFTAVPFIVWGFIANVAIDFGDPKLFPEDHNQNVVAKLLKEFASLEALEPFMWPRAKGHACNATSLSGSTTYYGQDCVFQWCQIDDRGTPAEYMSSAICYRSEIRAVQEDYSIKSLNGGLDSCLDLKIKNRFASGGYEAQERGFLNAWDRILKDVVSHPVPETSIRRSWWRSKFDSLVLEFWDTGGVQVIDFYEGTLDVTLNQTGDETCFIDTMCFAYMPGCTMGSEWINLGRFDMPEAMPLGSGPAPPPPTPAPTPAPAQHEPISDEHFGGFPPFRRLAEADVDYVYATSEVHIVWGIGAPVSSPLAGATAWQWRFDQSFDLSNPWAQRAINDACEAASTSKVSEELHIVDTLCWTDAFKEWLAYQNRRFPTRSFDEDVVTWFSQADEDILGEQIWFEDSKVVATQIKLWTGLPGILSAGDVLKKKELWDQWLSSLNTRASMSADRAWHVSKRWVDAEAYEAIINSTTITVTLQCLIGGLCVLSFTGDPVLAVIVLGLVVINIGGLAVFMVAVFKWSIGPIEVICLLIFVGYSVTFGLHVSGDYARVHEDDPDLALHHRMSQEMKRYSIFSFWKAFKSGEDLQGSDLDLNIVRDLTVREKRLGRARIAVLHVGGAILSAAFCSAGTGIFLTMCTLSIFHKCGVVVLTITALSVIVTLISLPAALIVCGPNFNPWYKRCFQYCDCEIRKRSKVVTA